MSSFWRALAGVDPAPDWLTDFAISQALLIDARSYVSDADLREHVAAYRAAISAGTRVIAVGHSQGNYYVNEAHAVLVLSVAPQVEAGLFKPIAVATPASFVAADGPWTTVFGDFIWLLPGALPPNTNNGECGGPFECHSFLNSYLGREPSRSRIVDGVVALLPANPPSLPDTWVQKTPMPTNRYLLTSSVVNGKIYAIGGQESSGTIVGRVDMYDPVANTWTPRAPMPTPRVIPASAEANGKIYVFGGDTTTPGGPSRSNIVEEYNPSTDTWVARAPMPTRRSWAAAATVNARIYVVGGADETGSFLTTVEAYDPSTNTWSPAASLNRPRAGLSAAVVGGKLYAIGGGTSAADVGTVEEYDPATNSWTSRNSMPTPRAQTCSSVVGEKILVIGGGNASGFLSANEQYDPANNSWTLRAPMPTPRQGLTCSAVGGRIFAIGGGNLTGFLSSNEVYVVP